MTTSDPKLYATLIEQLHDQIRHHEREARKARAALGTIKDLLGGVDPTRAKPRGGSGISRKELGLANRERIIQYFADNPRSSAWQASKALDLTYNTVTRHLGNINLEAPGVLDADRPSGN